MNHSTKKSTSFFKRVYHWAQKRPSLVFFFAVFSLMFLGGSRFNVLLSLVVAIMNAFFALLVYLFFNYLYKKESRWVKNQFVYILSIIFILIFLSFFLLGLEYWGSKVLLPSLLAESIPQEKMRYIFLVRFMKNLILVLASYSVSTYGYSMVQEKKATKSSLETELIRYQLLRSQMNPHFLFNALNNIYALTYSKDDKAPEAVIKLSEMLRYLTDISLAERVTIEKEIEYIRAYLEFQVMRLGEKADIYFDVDIDDPHQFILPMVLQPYIENCFTHGDIATNPKGFVHFSLSIKRQKLSFYSINSKSRVIPPRTQNRTGVGEINVEQRMMLFYKDAYSLQIKNEETTYCIDLTLDLTKKDIYGI
jgi:sensor histidine kinase YesM